MLLESYLIRNLSIISLNVEGITEHITQNNVCFSYAG